MSRARNLTYLGTIALLFTLAASWYGFAFFQHGTASASFFDGERALRDVQTQVGFGPRIPGSPAHASTLRWIQNELEHAGWTVQAQSTTAMGHPVTNLTASRTASPPQVLVGAHFDSRLYADRDPDPEDRELPTPGANDGASGVAVLLELARTLPVDTVPIWLVFFDGEDNGRIAGWDWALGSRAYVEAMTARPQLMVLVDMVGDSDLQIPMERNSDPDLRAAIWETAGSLGYQDVFLPRLGVSIIDDHLAFLGAGIPAVDIIDLEYPYWHTTSDTPDKISAESLRIVGDVLRTWLIGLQSPNAAPGS